MLYAILCYDSEEAVDAWTKEQDAAAMSKLAVVTENLARAGKLGPVARLMNTTSATTVRKARESTVLDGPFAETKEQLLGFFVVDCTSLDDAVGTARNLASCYNSNGAFEIRPLRFFNPGIGIK